MGVLGVDRLYELEKAKIEFKMIFNEDADKYRFAGVEQIKLVTEYGKIFGDLEQSLKMFTSHLNVQENLSHAGLHVNDEEIVSMIRNVV